MVELKGQNSSTSKNLATEILNVLNKYDINLQQIVTITSDNGSNMVKCTKILSHLCSEDEEYEENYNNETYFQNITLIENNMDLRVGNIIVCRCAAHTAQLVALDATKDFEMKRYIRQCRNLVKFLRKNSNGYKDLFELKSLKIPQLDCPTRWGSTYLMISCIQNSKEIVETVESITNKSSEENFEINEDFWNFVASYYTVFKPLQNIIVIFQEEQLHYGDFYAQWLKCKLLISKTVEENEVNKSASSYKISKLLLDNMEKRTTTLFSNNALAACLYLDPRFHHMLIDTQRKDAVEYLKLLWDKLTSICKIELNTQPTPNFITTTQENHEDDDILNDFLDNIFNANNAENDNIIRKIEKLNLPYTKLKTNVLEFWKERKYSEPELYALSNICFGIPPTQVKF